MALAVEQVRRMRGGAQSHLMRCSNQAYYVVKFQNNPQGLRILANELLGTRLAARLGLSVAEPEVVEVGAELIAHTEDLVIQLGRGRAPCKAGKQFGSRYPGNLADVAVYDFLPDEQLREVTNLAEFCGMLVFDKWTCNTNGRQAIFFRETDGAAHSLERGAGTATRYCARMIDNGFCFNAAEWNFPDAPLRGLYARHRVYESVRGMDSFEAWIARVERIEETALEEICAQIPPEWYDCDSDALERLLEQLLRRRKLVRELIVSAWKSSAQPFPNWK
ncbi:MAG: HipA family kinase [Candidatus Acidiferrales bacterium]